MASSSSSSSLSSVNNYNPTRIVQTPQLLQLFPTTPSQKPVFEWDLNEDPPVDVNDEIPAPGEVLSLQLGVAAVGGSEKHKRDEIEEEADPGDEENKKKQE